MSKQSKKYAEAKKLVDPNKKYSLEEAVELAKKTSYSKFVGTLEVAIKTFADPKYNDQMIRATTILPHGTGKTVKIAAFVSEDMIDEAKKMWADIAWANDLIKDIENGKIEFDIIVTTPDMMRDLAKVAKILWPKGLMPSPKAGTVTQNLKETIQEIKKGRVEFRLDKTGNIHVGAGKLSFTNEQLVENVRNLIKAIEENKPSGIKAKLIKKIVIAPTMGIWIQVDL